MVWKIIRNCVICVALVCAFCTTAHAATHEVYDEGQISSTYVTYFRDIVSGIGFNDNYVAFRSGQYSYTMVVGDLEYNDGLFSLKENGKEYVFSANNTGYNSQYNYNVNNITNFSVAVGDNIIYSDLGEFPQLVDRGAKIETFTAVLLCTVIVSVIINRILFKR